MLHAVIMAGGSGTRFWPESRAVRPKQLLDFTGGQTMIQATAARLGTLVAPQRTWVITSRALAGPIAEQLPQLAAEQIVAEPCRRDTAPAIGLAAELLLARDPKATMVVLPSDHVISPPADFQKALATAARLVDESPDRLVTFGIPPSYPAEIFGYIERGEEIAPGVFRVARFREKPQAEVAKEYLATGRFYWNAGIFVWRARTILDALAKHEPAMARHLTAIGQSIGRPDYLATLDREFAAIGGKSIDYAVLEKHTDVAVIAATFTWDDVGSWQALTRLRGLDADGNTILAKHIGLDTHGTLVRGPGNHLIVTVGVDDLIVVHTPDATLVAHKAQEESLRKVVEELKTRGWGEYL